MIDDMGIFRTTVGVSSLANTELRRDLHDVMVDTGSEYNWVPSDVLVDLGVAPVRVDRFETADGRILEREVGFALFYAGDGPRPRRWFSLARGTWSCSAHMGWRD